MHLHKCCNAMEAQMLIDTMLTATLALLVYVLGDKRA